MVFIEGWKFSPSRLLFHFDVYTKGTFFSYSVLSMWDIISSVG